MAGTNLTAEVLREHLAYDRTTGVFTRRRRNGTAAVGDIAGWVEPHGYVKISIAGRKYYAHRCAILYITGQWPVEYVDHVDGNPSNNAYDNLRCVSQSTNLQNLKRARADNTTGRLGVHFHRAAGRFTAECKADDGRRHYLGLFDSPDEASAAYLQAKRRLQSGCSI